MLKIISESHDEAKRLLNAHRQQLDALVEALLLRETLNEQEILARHGAPACAGPGDRDLAADRWGKRERSPPIIGSNLVDEVSSATRPLAFLSER